MSPNVERIYAEVMALDADERSELVDRLLESLDAAGDGMEMSVSDEEIRKRVQEVLDGTAKTIPWEEARAMMFRSKGE